MRNFDILLSKINIFGWVLPSEASSVALELAAIDLNLAVTPNVTLIPSTSNKRKLRESRKKRGVRVRVGLHCPRFWTDCPWVRYHIVGLTI